MRGKSTNLDLDVQLFFDHTADCEKGRGKDA